MALAESSGIQFGGLPFTMFIASDGEYIGAYIGELHQEHLDTMVDVMTRLDRAELSKDAARTKRRSTPCKFAALGAEQSCNKFQMRKGLELPPSSAIWRRTPRNVLVSSN